ncbi:MAG: WecB/TagA/CpsF family glycosyltransferase, partial [Myxococcota bacterium]
FGMLNAAKVVRMRGDPSLCRAVLESDVLLADGMSLVFAGRLLGKSLPERVTGIDLMHSLLEEAGAEGWRVYFLGATQEVLDAAVARAIERYPGLVVAGSHHGYFSEEEEAAIVAAIRDAGPDLLFVGMGSPKKERFLARWAAESGASVCHGVGGSFDVMAGLVRRAPQVVQAAGMEWLWRVAQEPRRLWKRYLVTNSAFSLMVGEAMLARIMPTRFRSASNPGWMPEPRGGRGGA